jgi:glycosyltransferase involved in cell wall biosynthesis
MATFDVLLPVRNGIDYLAESLDSLVSQSFRDWRLWVLDHGSSDGSSELAQSYAKRDARVNVRAFPQAQGLSGLLNCGLDLCDAKYVLRQDADDISLPERLETLFRVLESDRELAVVGSLGDVVDATGKRKIGSLDMPTGLHGVLASTPFRTPMAHPTVAMRLETIRRLGARYGEDFIKALPPEKRIRVPGLAEDYFLFGQLAMVSRCLNVDRSLIKYRFHGANVSATKYVDQMQVALNISRYLAKTLAAIHGTREFDPAPFCNHGMNLFAVDGRSDFSEDFEAMRSILVKALPPSDELSRELAYRKTLSMRLSAVMALRYGAYALRYGVRFTEWRTIRSWMIRKVKKQSILTLTPSGLCA